MLRNVLESLLEMGWTSFGSNYPLVKIVVSDNLETQWAIGDFSKVEDRLTVNDVVEINLYFESRTFKIWTKEQYNGYNNRHD